MDPILERPAMDDGERTLRRIARVCAVLALCWAAGGAYLASFLGLEGGVVSWVVGIVAFAPLYLCYAVAGEALGAATMRRWMNALRLRVPPALERRVGGPFLLLLVVSATIALAWLLVGGT